MNKLSVFFACVACFGLGLLTKDILNQKDQAEVPASNNVKSISLSGSKGLSGESPTTNAQLDLSDANIQMSMKDLSALQKKLNEQKAEIESLTKQLAEKN